MELYQTPLGYEEALETLPRVIVRFQKPYLLRWESLLGSPGSLGSLYWSKPAISRCPLAAAHIPGVRLYTRSLDHRSTALVFGNSCTISICPLVAAHENGVRP